MYSPIVNSYFCGAGGLVEGLNQGGCTVQQSLEIDSKACATLRLNQKHKVLEKDICTETVLDKDDCDVMAFTFPCNKYSESAAIHCTRTGDDLFLHALRHAALYRPEGFVLENVVGLRKFKIVMEAFTKMPDYYIRTFCPLNASIWLPQKRERLIIIATKRPFSISEPAPSVYRKTLKDIVEKDVHFDLPQYVLDRMNGKYRDLPIYSDPENKHSLAPTCVAHYSKDLGTRLLKDRNHPHGARPYTVREYARLQGFPDTYQFAGSNADAYRQIGNAVPVDMGRWIGQQFVKYFSQVSGKY